MSTVTLAEAKTHLNITAATNDSEIQSFLNRAEAAIAGRVREIGPPAAKSVRCDGGGRRGLTLPTGQAIASVTSVTPVGGTALTMGDLYVNLSAGVIEYNLGGYFSARAYDVAYMAGFTVTPEDLKLAVLEMVRHLWETQRRGRTSRSPETATTVAPSAAYALSPAVSELLRPFMRTQVA